MTRLVYGDRIGATATLKVGCSAVIFDPSGQKVLLTRRADNGLWCLPGGGMEAGESAAETCAREVLEETGLVVSVGKLVGIYTTPHRIVEYADGNRCQFVSLNFAAEIVDGELTFSDETTEFGYFTLEEMSALDMMEHHIQRVEDALADQPAAFVR